MRNILNVSPGSLGVNGSIGLGVGTNIVSIACGSVRLRITPIGSRRIRLRVGPNETSSSIVSRLSVVRVIKVSSVVREGGVGGDGGGGGALENENNY